MSSNETETVLVRYPYVGAGRRVADRGFSHLLLGGSA